MPIQRSMVMPCVWLAILASRLVAQERTEEDVRAISREVLQERVIAAMPQTGGAHGVFVDKNGFWTCVGYEFGTGNWYFARSDPAQQRLWGRDSRGYYSSDPLGGALVPEAGWREERSYRMDNYFPQIGLLTLLRDDSVEVEVKRSDDTGGWVVTIQLPRALRFPTTEELPDAEVKRWSTGGSVLRPAVYQVDQDLAVRAYTYPATPSIEAPRLRTLEYDVAPESPGGFQVVSQWGGFRLAELSLVPASARSFDRTAVFAEMRDRREADRVRDRVPVVTAEYADEHPELRPAPIEGGGGSSWVIGGAAAGAGLLAILLGVVAWLRNRQS
ncbi:MAG: hypothetical protein IPJ41_18500 [Phycisphaerales bacterium]|nr:hypothetical protein [Phycisphaerales bacterium]